jgi:hypothetical protein
MVEIVGLVIFAGCLWAGWSTIAATRKMRGWPVVPGRIVERSVVRATTAGSSRRGPSFEPKVTYAYSVEGKSYSGTRIGLVQSSYDAATARRVVNRLPEAATVHYNPQDPVDACLRPSALRLGIFMVLLGAFGVVIAAGLLIAKLAA